MATHSSLLHFNPRLGVEKSMLEEKLKWLDSFCAKNKIEPLALSQVEECRSLQFQCERREVAIIRKGEPAESIASSLFSSIPSSFSWLKTHILQDDRVLRFQNLAGMPFWSHRLEFPQIEPLSPNARQHIYGWDACDYRHLDWLVMTGRVSSHQDNRVPAEELVRVKEKESPPSEPGYGPQSDPNYGTGPSLESAPVRDSDLLVDKPDSGKSVRPMPEPRQFPMRESSRKSHGAEQWTYNSPSRPLYRCPTCHKIVNSKSELKEHHLCHNKPFHCIFADCYQTEGFSTVNDLNTHMQSKHSGYPLGEIHSKSYRCLVGGCKSQDKIWPDLDNLRSHLKHMHQLQYDAIDYFVQHGELEIRRMMQRPTWIDFVSLDPQSSTSWDFSGLYSVWDSEPQHTITTNETPSFLPNIGNGDNAPSSAVLTPPNISQDAASSHHVRKDSVQLHRPAHESGYFEQQNASYASQLDVDAFMAGISPSERASVNCLPPREEGPALLSPLALLSSVATSQENSNRSMAFPVQNCLEHSLDIAIPDTEEPPVIPRGDCETHTEGLPISKEDLSAPQPAHPSGLFSKSRQDTLAPAPSEDEEMEDTPDDNNQLASSAPKTETAPKLRKHPAKFECYYPGCKKRFTRRVNLDAHMHVHSNDVPTYDCTECHRKFKRIEDHKRHVKELHVCTAKQHVCGVLGTPGSEGCGRSFTRAEALRRHLRSKAGSRCGKFVHEEESEEGRRISGDETSVNGSLRNRTSKGGQERIIDQNRQSEKIQAIGNDTAMTYEEAMKYLNVSQLDPHDHIERIANRMASAGDYFVQARVALALRVIGRHRKERVLERALEILGTMGAINIPVT